MTERARFINGSGFLSLMISRKRSKRKATGGLYKDFRKRRKSEGGRQPAMTRVGEVKNKVQRVLGGNLKRKVLQTNTINLFDGNAYVKATIKNVVDNKANRNYIRRNILTKGAVVDTDKGKAVITSRPGQIGSLNGVVFKE